MVRMVMVVVMPKRVHAFVCMLTVMRVTVTVMVVVGMPVFFFPVPVRMFMVMNMLMGTIFP